MNATRRYCRVERLVWNRSVGGTTLIDYLRTSHASVTLKLRFLILIRWNFKSQQLILSQLASR